MIAFWTLLIMLATAWAQYRNGLFSSVAMLFKVIVSGVVAFYGESFTNEAGLDQRVSAPLLLFARHLTIPV